MYKRTILSAALCAALIGGVAAAQNTTSSVGTGAVSTGTSPITNGAIAPGPAATYVPGVGLVPYTPTVGNGRIYPNLLNQGGILPNQFSINNGGVNLSDPYGLAATAGSAIDPFGLTANTSSNFTNNGYGSGVFGNGSFPQNVGTYNPTLGGYGGGYYPGYYGYGSGPILDTSGAFWALQNQSIVRPPAHGAIVPTLGVNVPAGSLAARNAYLGTPRATSGGNMRRLGQRTRRNVEERVAGSRQELRESESPEQVQLVEHIQDVMNDRPLREGTIVKIGATALQVRYRLDGETRTDRVPVDQVFFFQGDGTLASAATRPGLLHTGDRVMIPQGTVKRASLLNQQTAIETRGALRSEVEDRVRNGEEIASDAVVITPTNPTEQTAQATTDVQERVAGSRQEVRGNTGNVTTDGSTVQSRVAGYRSAHRSTTNHRRAAR